MRRPPKRTRRRSVPPPRRGGSYDPRAVPDEDDEPELDEWMVPEMTGEQQAYYDEYLVHLEMGRLLVLDWSPEDTSAIPGGPSGASMCSD